MNNMFTLKMIASELNKITFQFPTDVKANDLALIVVGPHDVFAKVCSGYEDTSIVIVTGNFNYENDFISISPPDWTVIGPREVISNKCPTCKQPL